MGDREIGSREECHVKAFLRRDMLPYAPDAWYNFDKIKIGYDNSFNHYFYKPQPLHGLEEIQPDIIGVEKETGGLFDEILGDVSK